MRAHNVDFRIWCCMDFYTHDIIQQTSVGDREKIGVSMKPRPAPTPVLSVSEDQGLILKVAMKSSIYIKQDKNTKREQKIVSGIDSLQRKDSNIQIVYFMYQPSNCHLQ